MPADTLCHSTTTVPLNRSGSMGRRTTHRVRNGAAAPAVTSQWPSTPRSPRNSYEMADPSTLNSVSS